MCLKTPEWKKVTYSLICVFVLSVLAKKKNKEMKSPTMEMY